MQIDKTPANQENIFINLTTRAKHALQMQKTTTNDLDTIVVAAICGEFIEVWSMYHPFRCMLWVSDFCYCLAERKSGIPSVI